MPTQQEGQDRCYKLPYVSSQMLAIQSQIFYALFFGGQGQYLGMLFRFLGTHAVDNQLLLGYFQKVVNNLQKGRKLELTTYISKNLHLFTSCLHLQTIGTLLKSCIILQNQKQGILYSQRKDILQQLVHNFVVPSNPSKAHQIRDVTLSAIVDVLGKHKTFSSGDQLVAYLFQACGELLVVYGMVGVDQVTRLLQGILGRSLQKIYNPELDVKQNIFKLPPSHVQLLLRYLPLRLHHLTESSCTPPPPPPPIRQQNGKQVPRLSRNLLDYVSLLCLTLQNNMDTFLIPQSPSCSCSSPCCSSCSQYYQSFNSYMDFSWQLLLKHPKNDIALVQIVRIFNYICGEGSQLSQNQGVLRDMILRWGILSRMYEVVSDGELEMLLRPHLWQIWDKLRVWVAQSGDNWKKICDKYEPFIPLYKKTQGLNYNRPNQSNQPQKLVVDEQDITQNSSTPIPNFEPIQKQPQQPPQLEFPTNHKPQPQPQPQPSPQTQTMMTLAINQKIMKKQYQITKEMEDWMAETSTGEGKGREKDGGSSGFDQFDFFANNQSNQQNEKKGEKSADFSDFDTFM